MNKLEKPKFFTGNSFINIIGIVGFILGVVQFLIPENLLSLKYKLFIFTIIFVFCLIIYLIQYIINWHNLYHDYLIFYQKFNELDSRYKTRIEEIKNKDNLIKEYENFIDKLNIFIITALTRNSATETKQLKNMQELLFLSIEHLNRLKGGNGNGGNL